MTARRQLSVTLPEDLAEMVERKVASGAYADEGEVIRDGLRALKENDVVERWLRDEVAATFDAYKAGKIKTSSLETVRNRLSRHIQDQQPSR